MAFKPRNTKEEPENFPDNEMEAIIDLDYVRYAVASVGEEVVIKAIYKHKEGVEKEFKNITAFRGRSKKTIGGWLGELNAEREEQGKKPFLVEDFEIQQVQRRKVEVDVDGEQLAEDQSTANVMHSAKQMVLSDLKAAGTDKYLAILGKGKSFREGVSTLMKYKGNRDNVLRPLLMDDVTDYLKRKFNPEVVEGIEADDRVIQLAYGHPNRFVMGVDKDMYSQPVKVFNPNRPEEGIIDCDCLGKLYTAGEGSNIKVRGHGRLHLYYQMLAGDTSDNYKGGCASSKRLGSKGVYNYLHEAENDQEALQLVIDKFKELYPEPLEVETWRGNKMWFDWYRVADEQFQMARMHRWEGDIMSFEAWCSEYGVSCE